MVGAINLQTMMPDHAQWKSNLNIRLESAGGARRPASDRMKRVPAGGKVASDFSDYIQKAFDAVRNFFRRRGFRKVVIGLHTHAVEMRVAG